MKIFVEFEGKFYEIEKLKDIDIKEISNNLYLVILNNKPYLFSLKDFQNGKLIDDGLNKYFIKIHHGLREVSVQQIHRKVEILSPIPGLVVDVLVSENQKVKKDEILFIIEAMKMRNQIKSPVDGIVKNIKVQKGKSVNMKEVLAIIET
ncbi:MAG: acetyl-CoA carboxylase biotin carboxyl carrier protein subunit [candidate division WOR-3 bacterium]